jgi:hypothetical protein
MGIATFSPFRLTAGEAGGMPDIQEALQKGFKSAYMPSQMSQNLLKTQIANRLESAKVPYADRMAKADLAYKLASTGHIGADTERLNITNKFLPNRLEQENYEQKIKNMYLPESEKARISKENAMVNYYKTSAGGGSTGSKDYAKFESGVQADNPQLSQEQIREAADAYANGRNVLNDGTKLNPMTFGTQQALERTVKASTTANLLNSGIKAAQAESELKAGNEYINKLGDLYGTTYLGYSWDQLKDSVSKDPESQKKLGRYMGVQALQYELSQIRNRQAGGEPGISATNLLMGHSGQIIENHAPRITGIAREEARKTIDEGLSKMFKARNKVSVGGSTILKNRNEAIQEDKEKEVGYQEPPPEGAVWGYIKDPNTNEISKLPIPKKELKEFIADGGSIHG